MTTTPDLQLYANLWDPKFADSSGGHNENWATLSCPHCGNVARSETSFYVRTYEVSYHYLIWEGPLTGSDGNLLIGSAHDSESNGDIQLVCSECGSEVSWDGDWSFD